MDLVYTDKDTSPTILYAYTARNDLRHFWAQWKKNVEAYLHVVLN